ncbi:MAG: phosphodiester glycosidase family protein, partial [Ferruginibacter sp.]|nr:phosphodiester glycosidase family protein [Cytophagales bacterium]
PTRGAFGLINRKPDVAWVYGLGGSVEGGDNTTYQYPVPSPVNAANPPPPPPTPDFPAGGGVWPASQALGGGPVLVENGAVRVTTTEELFEGIAGPNPRTAVGYVDDQTVILLVVDGRQESSVGTTLEELASIMVELGAKEALNLDGGGSSTMVAANEVVNLPSDDGRNALRRVASALVLSEAVETPRREVVILDTDGEQYTEIGLWSNSSDKNYYGRTAARLASANAGSRARYRFLKTAPGRYQLAAWWTVSPTAHATNTPYVLHRGNQIDTIRANQASLETAGKWNVLGDFELGANDYLEILSQASGGKVVADAIRLVALEKFPPQPAARGDLRIAVISDLNASLGANTYEWQVDSIVQRIPRLWKPDLVVCGGDLVAGQGVSNVEIIRNMWKGFDDHIAKPFRDRKVGGDTVSIPFAFTIGNHDGSRAYPVERALTKEYWDTARTHLQFVDQTHFPYYYSFRLGDAFFVSWDASAAVITEENLAWVREQFSRSEARNARMRFVVGHLPLYSVAQERDNPGDVLAKPEELRRLLQELDVRTYISGHHHAYFPGKRGGLQLLNAGAAGSGPRQWLTLTRPPENTVTLMDVFFERDSIAYTTYEIGHRNPADMPVFNERELPRIIYGVNGFIIRHDVRTNVPQTGELSSLNLREARPPANPAPAAGDVRVESSETAITVSGAFRGLRGKVRGERTSVALYEGRHGENGRFVAALEVASTDGRNGAFSGQIPLTSDRWTDGLAGGGVYVQIQTDSVPGGEVRTQLYPADNQAPNRIDSLSANARNVYAVRDIEALFRISWKAAADPDGDPVTYLYQLAADATFQRPLLQVGTGRLTEVKPREQDLYALLEAETGQPTTLYHRVVATDGRNVATGPTLSIQLTRSDEPLDDLVEVPAPNYVYDGRLAPGTAVNGYGAVYDRSGKLWLSTFSNLIYVLNPDGTEVSFSPLGTATFGASSNNTGVSIDRDGNILVSRNSRLFKVDAGTGTVMATWQSPNRTGGAVNTLTTPRAGTDGRVYVASLWGDDYVYALEPSPTNPSAFVQVQRITLPDRILSRTFAMSPDARTMYLPDPTRPLIQVFTSVNGQTYRLSGTLTSVAAGSSSLEVGADSTLLAAVRPSGVLPTTLHFRDERNKRLWTLPLLDGNTEPRGSIAFSPNRDTLVIPSWTGTQGFHRYVLRRAGEEPTAVIRNIPTYRIGQVRGIDTAGVADSLGVYCALEGIVNSPNFTETGLDFALVDGPAGINGYRSSDDGGYSPKTGDRLRVVGRIVQTAGLTRLRIDSLKVLSSDNDLALPRYLGEVTDSLESLPVRLTRVRLVDTGQWTRGEGYYGFAVDVSGGDDRYRLFIHRNTPLYYAEPPQGEFDVTGILSQFKSEAPYWSGYEILPRTEGDLVATKPGYSEVVGAEPALSEGLHAYPSPTEQFLRIRSEQRAIEGAKISTVDGKLMREFSWKSHPKNVRLDLGSLRAGVYVLRVRTGSGWVSRRIVKR